MLVLLLDRMYPPVPFRLLAPDVPCFALVGSLVPRTLFHDAGMKADRMGSDAATTPNVRSINVQSWRWMKFPGDVSDRIILLRGRYSQRTSLDNLFCSIWRMTEPIQLIAPILKTKYSRSLVPQPIRTFHRTISGTESKAKSMMTCMTLKVLPTILSLVHLNCLLSFAILIGSQPAQGGLHWKMVQKSESNI